MKTEARFKDSPDQSKHKFTMTTLQEIILRMGKDYMATRSDDAEFFWFALDKALPIQGIITHSQQNQHFE